MSTSQDKSWEERGQAAEAIYAHQKEQEQLARLRAVLDAESSAAETSAAESSAAKSSAAKNAADARDRNFEGGFGGQEDLEDRYATTSGEH